VKICNTIYDIPILFKSDISILFSVSDKYRISKYRYLYRKCPALIKGTVQRKLERVLSGINRKYRMYYLRIVLGNRVLKIFWNQEYL
jgi:hypothetical protein